LALADKTINCRDCGSEFVFTVGEQLFYQEKGLRNEPQRCPPCRSAHRQRSAGPRTMTDVVCASCGQPTTVPFVPRYDRPIYCPDCFAKQKGANPAP